MRGVAIYMEGDGSRAADRAALRQGMDGFPSPLKNAARKRSLPWKVVPCGSREDTYRRFRNGVENSDHGETQVLIVDSEAKVTLPAQAHLRNRDGWDLSFTLEQTIHLMVQVMETWIVADPGAIARYYGQDFDVRRLPRRPDLEQEPKASVAKALKDATKRSAKGAYHKTRHAGELLKRLDQARVKDRCRHCKRLFGALGGIIEAA